MDHFDSNSSLSQHDFDQLKSWGMNVIRLGVMWEPAEPTQGQWNETYYEEMLKLVRMGANSGVYFIIDQH